MKNDKIEKSKIMVKDKIEVVSNGMNDNERDIDSNICCSAVVGPLRG